MTRGQIVIAQIKCDQPIFIKIRLKEATKNQPRELSSLHQVLHSSSSAYSVVDIDGELAGHLFARSLPKIPSPSQRLMQLPQMGIDWEVKEMKYVPAIELLVQ